MILSGRRDKYRVTSTEQFAARMRQTSLKGRIYGMQPFYKG